MPTKYMKMPDIKTGKENNYSDLLTQSFNIIDSHNHSTVGKGINQASIDWQAIDFAGFGVLNANYINFSNINNSLTQKNTFFVKNRDLYYVDGNLNEIQITKKGFVNTTSAFDGGFTGDYVQSGATCDYIDDISAYNFLASNGNVLTSLYFNDVDTFISDISVTTLNAIHINCNYIRPSYYDDKIETRYSMIAFDENQSLFMSNFYYNEADYPFNINNFFHFFNSNGYLRKQNPFTIDTLKTKFVGYTTGDTPQNDSISQRLYKVDTVNSLTSVTCIMRSSYAFKPTTPLSAVILKTSIDTTADDFSVLGCSFGSDFSFHSPEIAICCRDGVVFYGDTSGAGYKVQFMCYYKKTFGI